MQPWTNGRVRANAIEMAYLRTGGAHPPVVLLHGLTDNGACWTRLARDLEDDYDLIMPDARGHGGSAVPETGYRAEDRAADALALIDELGLDRPALIGHSMGGLTAALIAATAPGKIGKVILEDPAFISAAGWADRLLRAWPEEHAATLALSEAALIAKGRAENPRWSADVLATWARAKLETKLKVFDWFQLPPTDFTALVARIGVPTLLVTGEPTLGAVVSAEVAEQLRACNPRLRIAHMPGVGHCIRYEQPAHFATLVRNFLAEEEPGPSL